MSCATSSLANILNDYKGDYSSLFTNPKGYFKFDANNRSWTLIKGKIPSKEIYYENLKTGLSFEKSDNILNPDMLAKEINDYFQEKITCSFKPNRENAIYFKSKDLEYSFLSNFYPTILVVNGKFYPSAEHAYQIGKTRNLENIELEDSKETPSDMAKYSSLQIKKKMKQISMLEEDTSKLSRMNQIVEKKFTTNQKLKQALIKTSPYTLIEATDSEFWGKGNMGNGKNHLGTILMNLRDRLIQEKDA